MKSSLKAVPGSESAHAWNILPDIEQVSDRLTHTDTAFFSAIGALLARAKQTTRFAMTLLHSHFHVDPNEVLVEATDEVGQIVTSVRNRADSALSEIVPRSWAFNDNLKSGLENIRPLTWIESSGLEVPALTMHDSLLLEAIASEFLRWEGANPKFGMALAPQCPRDGYIWTEASYADERLLVQEQQLRSEVELRNPIRTMWLFDETGSFQITMGCCIPLTSNRGHSGRRHPRGIS